ncbi:hypothetical protein Dip518_000175 [Parelusimicrobium proximum]|uniref:hypothetical protein n=1 Tax=Parelusimicrobium proximum TaxID=3228953 RepID=UPI003D163F18
MKKISAILFALALLPVVSFAQSIYSIDPDMIRAYSLEREYTKEEKTVRWHELKEYVKAIKCGDTPAISYGSYANNWYATMEAVYLNDLQSLKEIEKAGHLVVLYTERTGRAPLNIAAEAGNLQITQFLLHHGAPVYPRETNIYVGPTHKPVQAGVKAPLISALEGKNKKVLQAILARPEMQTFSYKTVTGEEEYAAAYVNDYEDAVILANYKVNNNRTFSYDELAAYITKKVNSEELNKRILDLYITASDISAAELKELEALYKDYVKNNTNTSSAQALHNAKVLNDIITEIKEINKEKHQKYIRENRLQLAKKFALS